MMSRTTPAAASCRYFTTSLVPSTRSLGLSSSSRRLVLSAKAQTFGAGAPRITPQARHLATASAPTTTSNSRLVVSRRVWKAYEQTLPKQASTKKAKEPEKPWPQNVRIAGYVALAVAIPYSCLWAVSHSPKLREVVGDSMVPLDMLRSHFGQLEWDAVSYEDAQNDILQEEKAEIPIGYYQLNEEAPYRERQQEATLQQLEQEPVTLNIHLVGEETSSIHKTVQQGTAKANFDTLRDLAGTQENSHQALAVDFEDSTASSSDTTSMNGSETEQESSSFAAQDNSPADPLLHQTHTFSTWYYARPAAATDQDPGSKASKNNNADDEINIMRLEHTIEELNKSLKDPMGTRDIDDMTAELKQAKKDLSRLKWKRRLGICNKYITFQS